MIGLSRFDSDLYVDEDKEPKQRADFSKSNLAESRILGKRDGTNWQKFAAWDRFVLSF